MKSNIELMLNEQGVNKYQKSTSSMGTEFYEFSVNGKRCVISTKVTGAIKSYVFTDEEGFNFYYAGLKFEELKRVFIEFAKKGKRK